MLRQRIPVKPLSELALAEKYRQISELLNGHKAENCEYCDFTYLNENCYILQETRKILDICNDPVKIQIYEKLVSDMKSEERWVYLQRKYDDKFFSVWVCLCNGLRIDYDSIENIEDFHFVGKFGIYVNSIKFDRDSSYFDYTCFSYTLNTASNLRKLVFDCNIDVSDKILELVGKCCHNIREIIRTGENCSEECLSVSGYARLIFRDFERKQNPNPCCQTLQVLELESRPNEYSPSRFLGVTNSFVGRILPKPELELKEFLSMLNTYLPNIRSFGLYTPIDEMIDYFETETKIESASIQKLHPRQLEPLQRLFPKLHTLHCNLGKNTTIDELQVLQKLELTTLSTYVTSQITDYPLYNENISANWLSLKCLLIENVHLASLEKIDISLFARKLPSLEELYICEIRDIIWDEVSKFQTLKNFSIKRIQSFNRNWILNERDAVPLRCNWFLSLAETIKTFKITYDEDYLSVDDTTAILSRSYPFLEDLNIQWLNSENADLVKNFVNNCPNLHSIGEFMFHEDVDEELESPCIELDQQFPLVHRGLDEKELNDYFKENNIHCVVHVKQDQY